MKKILILLLVLAVTIGAMASCDVLADLGFDLGDLGIGGETPDTPDTPDEPDEPEVDADLQLAYDYVHQNVKTIAEVTGANYTLIGSALIGDKNFAITWSVSDERISLVENEDGTYTVVVPSKTYEDIPYQLSFSVINEKGEKLERSYNHVVPAFKVSSFDEYMAAKEGDNLVVKGIVVAINAKSAGNTRNHLFLADEDVVGGYYSYQMDQDPLEMGIEVGMTVLVTGPAAPYSGMMEIKGGVAEIVSTEKKTVDFIDVTEDFANGDNLAKYTALPVVIKGVTIGTQELGGSSDYLKFSLNGKESYIRSYKTDFPTTLPADAKATIEADHAAHFGYVADVYGLVVLYSNNPYLIPLSVDCFTNYVEVEKTPEEMVDAELSLLNIATKYTADAVVELLAAGKNYTDVTFAWTVEGTGATLEGNTLTLVVPDEKSVVTLKVTATCGEISKEKTFEITLSKELTPVADIIALGSSKEHNTYTTEKYLVGGVITEVYNDQYGNMYITDAEGNTLTIYGTYDATGANRYDAMESKPVAGDYVVILGVVGQYNGTAQIKNGWILSFTSSTSVKDALDLGASKEHNTYTDEKHLVTGVITDVYNTQYGNMKITDAEGNILTVYGTYDATGANRYDAMSYKPVVGDTVTVYGIVGQYNGTAQLKNAWIVVITKGTTEPPVHEHNFVDGKCECGETDPNYVPPTVDPDLKEIVFDFGANGDASHVDGTEITTGTKTFTSNGYELVLTGISKVYDGAFDKNGNSILKFGTSSLAGTITFEVPANVTSVIIKAAPYKFYNDNNIVVVNGTSYTLGTDGYTSITVDTTTTKTVTVASSTAATKPRCMIDAIVFVLGEGSAPVDPQPPVHEHNFVEGKCECGETDPNYVPPTVEPTPSTYPIATELKNGDKIIIGAPAYGKLLSMVKVATYYNKGVNYSANDFSNVTDDEIFVVTVNEDGSYGLVSVSGKVLAQGTYSSLDVAGANKTWSIEAKAGAEGIFYLKNNGTGKYLEWYASKDNWSTYGPANSDLFELHFYVVEAAEGGENVDPQPPVHEHNFVDGKCECGEEDPNYVPPTEDPTPEVGAPAGSADFDTITLPSSKPNGDSSYTGSYTTANGWTIANSAIQCGGSTDMNPQFVVIGSSNASKAPCLNGKTSAAGKITSSTLTGGVSKITLDYTKMFTDTVLEVTITVTDLATGEKQSVVIHKEAEKNDKYSVWTYEWVLETAITGDFTIEVVNNCPSGVDGNKDRITILDLSWYA